MSAREQGFTYRFGVADAVSTGMAGLSGKIAVSHDGRDESEQEAADDSGTHCVVLSVVTLCAEQTARGESIEEGLNTHI